MDINTTVTFTAAETKALECLDMIRAAMMAANAVEHDGGRAGALGMFPSGDRSTGVYGLLENALSQGLTIVCVDVMGLAGQGTGYANTEVADIVEEKAGDCGESITWALRQCIADGDIR